MQKLTPLLAVLLMLSCAPTVAAEEDWIDLFDGEDLSGWTVKITGQPLGEDPDGTFRVGDGLLKVRYDSYDAFDNRFGHLFWKDPYSRYHLVVEYRFVGEQLKGGAGWAIRNSGVMLHAQAPETMTLDQDFPDSVEAQFLGGLDNGKPRPTGNLCTPGTDVVFQGALYTPHCLPSSSKTYAGDQWVRAELIVEGSDKITHIINGEVVLEYIQPRLSSPTSHSEEAVPALLDRGFIALQSESHPLEFRKIQIRML